VVVAAPPAPSPASMHAEETRGGDVGVGGTVGRGGAVSGGGSWATVGEAARGEEYIKGRTTGGPHYTTTSGEH
jgi:hypothetical protein